MAGGAILHSQFSILTSSRWTAGLLLISAALLGFEVLLMRLLALAYWGHFAGMVISIAMLGIACSGLFLFSARAQVKAKPQKFFALSAGLFGLAAPVAFLCSQQLPFSPFLLTWSAREYAFLAARSVLFFVPFFLAGVAIGVPFVARVLPAGRLYFWNMVGSGLAAGPLLFAMNFTHPMRLLACVAAVAVAVPIFGTRSKRVRLAWFGAVLGIIALVFSAPFRYSEYKELPKTLLLPQARVIGERYGWDGVVQIVDSPHTRFVPGLSLNFAGLMPRTQLIFTDAGNMTLAFAAKEALANADFLRMTPEAFSYLLAPKPRVLQFYGSTVDLLRARSFGATDIRVVDDSETRVRVTRELLAANGEQHASTLFVHGDPRQILEQETAVDVIGLSLLGTHGTSTAGAASLDASFLITLEGFSRIYERLTPRGHAVISTWVENPARSGVRLAILCAETLRRHGRDPSRHLLAIRSWSTLSILLGREPFDVAAIAGLKTFCEENSFDLVWFPGINPTETNQINFIPEDPYYEAFAALVGEESQEFIARAPFALQPPTDDRPFFHQYFRWASVPQWISTMGMGWLPFVEWGYILHVATLAVVALLGVLFLIVPCLFVRSQPALQTAGLFFLLGVAYMFVQSWMIQKLSQFVAHPLLASAIVLSAMLSASGAGAAILTRNPAATPGRKFLLLCGGLAVAMALFPFLMRWIFPQALWLRIALAIAWLALPAFFMGFPFPYSLMRLRKESDVPWALALNGFGSVLGALLATLVAVHFGLLALGLSALVLYALIAMIPASRVAASV